MPGHSRAFVVLVVAALGAACGRSEKRERAAPRAPAAASTRRDTVVLAEESRVALDLAAQAAAQTKNSRVEPAHIALGILRGGDNSAARVVRGTSADTAALARRLLEVARLPASDTTAARARGYSARAMAALTAAIRSAEARRDEVTTVDLLLGALTSGDAATTRALAAAGVTPEVVRRAAGRPRA